MKAGLKLATSRRCKQPLVLPHMRFQADLRRFHSGRLNAVRLYRECDGTAASVLLWMDARADMFWDVALWQLKTQPQPARASRCSLASLPPEESDAGSLHVRVCEGPAGNRWLYSAVVLLGLVTSHPVSARPGRSPHPGCTLRGPRRECRRGCCRPPCRCLRRIPVLA